MMEYRKKATEAPLQPFELAEHDTPPMLLDLLLVMPRQEEGTKRSGHLGDKKYDCKGECSQQKHGTLEYRIDSKT
jgi:hypothetical protein